MLYSYQKATSKTPSPGKIIPRYLRILPTLISSLGLGMVASVVWPMASYNLSLKLNEGGGQNNLLSPIIYESFASESNSSFENEPTLIADIDYTKASNWFTFSPIDSGSKPVSGESQFINLNYQPPAATLSERPVREEQYNLAIPSLGIKEAEKLSQIIKGHLGLTFRHGYLPPEFS